MALENLQITASKRSGGEISLPRPLWLKLEKSVTEPASKLTLTYPPETEIPDISQIKLSGDLTFSGLVDSISHEQTDNGKYIVVKCRSMAALLLDNHASPHEYTYPSNTDILDRYCFMMGFKGFLYDEYHQVPSISATRGTSCWSVVEAYCEQTFGRPPHVTEDGYISSLPYGDTVVHTFGGDGLPIYEISRITDNTAPISSVSLRNENGAYSISVTNSHAPAGTRRHRYVIPEAPWLNYRELLGQRILRRSMSEYRVVKIKTPAVLNAQIGDRATINGDTEGTVWRIAKLTLTADENGILTDITLYDSEFFE